MDLEAKFEKWFQGTPWLNVGDYTKLLEFSSHFFFHAFLAFLSISLPAPFCYFTAPLSFIYAVVKEMVIDKHGFHVFKDLDGRTDLISRGSGSLIPIITLLWR